MSSRADAVAPPDGRSLESIAVVGVGLIGASLALALREARPGVRLVGIDRGAALDGAASLGVFETVADRLDAAADVDLVVLAAPVRQNERLLGELAGVLTRRVLVTDTGSTKRAVLQAARTLPSHISFVGGHPLAGAAQSGAEAARATLFRGRPWLLTPTPATRSAADIDDVGRLATDCGAEPHVIDAEAHDRLVAAISHVPQLTASALMHVIGQAVGEKNLQLAGAGLVDTTRLAASSPAIWQDICATNADAIGPCLDALIETLERLRSDLRVGSAIEDVFTSARRLRQLID